MKDGSGELVAQYTYAPGYIDSPARQQRDLNGDTDFADTDEVVYYHSNTLHSVYLLSDSASSAVERYRYDAYGGATVLDADGSDDSDGLSDVENPYAFTARRLDLESDLMYYRNRQYSVTLGRFISRDRLAKRGGRNWFEYVSSLPAQSTDPLGLWRRPYWKIHGVITRGYTGAHRVLQNNQKQKIPQGSGLIDHMTAPTVNVHVLSCECNWRSKGHVVVEKGIERRPYGSPIAYGPVHAANWRKGGWEPGGFSLMLLASYEDYLDYREYIQGYLTGCAKDAAEEFGNPDGAEAVGPYGESDGDSHGGAGVPEAACGDRLDEDEWQGSYDQLKGGFTERCEEFCDGLAALCDGTDLEHNGIYVDVHIAIDCP